MTTVRQNMITGGKMLVINIDIDDGGDWRVSITNMRGKPERVDGWDLDTLLRALLEARSRL